MHSGREMGTVFGDFYLMIPKKPNPALRQHETFSTRSNPFYADKSAEDARVRDRTPTAPMPIRPRQTDH